MILLESLVNSPCLALHLPSLQDRPRRSYNYYNFNLLQVLYTEVYKQDTILIIINTIMYNALLRTLLKYFCDGKQSSAYAVLSENYSDVHPMISLV